MTTYRTVASSILLLVSQNALSLDLSPDDITLGLGYAVGIERTTEFSLKGSNRTIKYSGWFQDRPLAEVRLMWNVTPTLQTGFIHISDPTAHDPGYGLTAILTTLKLK